MNEEQGTREQQNALEKSHQRRKKLLFDAVVALGIVLFVVYHFSDLIRGDENFQSKTDAEIAQAVKKFDSQITDAALTRHNNKDILLVNFRTKRSVNPLGQDADALKDIAHKVVQADKDKKIDYLGIAYLVPAVDKFNNKTDAVSLSLVWRMDMLRRVNWKGFQGFSFLELVEGIQDGDLGIEVISDYCQNIKSYNRHFCQKVGIEEY